MIAGIKLPSRPKKEDLKCVQIGRHENDDEKGKKDRIHTFRT